MKGSSFTRSRHVLALIFLSAFLAACSVQNPPSAAPDITPVAGETLVVTTTTPTSRPALIAPMWTLTPTPTPGEARDEVVSALEKLQQAGPMHIHSVTTGADGKSVVLDGDVILPDRFHITSAQQEILVVGDQSFIKQDGQWENLGMDVSGLVKELVGNLSTEAIQSVHSAVLIHAELVDGLPTHEYQYHSTLNLGGQTVDSQNQIWISDASGMPVRLEATGTLSGVQYTTVQEISYDPSIKIELPAP